MFEHPPPVSEVDVLESPDAVAAELATSLPRADDVAALLMLDPDTLPDAGRVDLLVACERHIALLQAAQQQILAVLNSLGNAQTDDRSADQRRADALVDVFARALADPSLPEQHGKRPAIHVTVPLSTLPGCDNQPAHLDRYGPITAALARRLAADQSGTRRRLVTDDTGQLLDYGRTTYRAPTNLTDHVTARDQACTFPGCRRAAELCDLDHVEAWTDGGDTNPANLAAPCARHHNANHHASWQVKHRQ